MHMPTYLSHPLTPLATRSPLYLFFQIKTRDYFLKKDQDTQKNYCKKEKNCIQKNKERATLCGTLPIGTQPEGSPVQTAFSRECHIHSFLARSPLSAIRFFSPFASYGFLSASVPSHRSAFFCKYQIHTVSI